MKNDEEELNGILLLFIFHGIVRGNTNLWGNCTNS